MTENTQPSKPMPLIWHPDEKQREDLQLLDTSYMLLEQLLDMQWANNPKAHQESLIEYSVINLGGFNDPVECAPALGLLVAGHGRTNFLKGLKATNQPAPKHIATDQSGNWWVPTIILDFEDLTQAYRYALMSNRAGVTRLSPEDYDGVRLSKALRDAQAGAGMQLNFLPGFSDEDKILGGSVGTSGGLQMPDLPAFDAAGGVFEPGKLEGVPDYQEGQAPQSFVAMVTVPTFEDLKRVVAALTGGKRRGLASDAKFASVEGSALLPFWEARLLGEGAALAAVVDPQAVGALPGQITFAGGVVGEQAGELQLLPEGQRPAVYPDISNLNLPTGISISTEMERAYVAELQKRETLLVAAGLTPDEARHAVIEMPELALPAEVERYEEMAEAELQGGLDPAMAEDPADIPFSLPEPELTEAQAQAQMIADATVPDWPNGYGPGSANPPPAPLSINANTIEMAAANETKSVPVGKYAGLKVPPVPVFAPAPRQASLLPTPPVVTPAAPQFGTPPAKLGPQAPDHPKWSKGGQCPACFGAGFTGWRGIGQNRHKIACSACDGHGTKEAWEAAHGAVA